MLVGAGSNITVSVGRDRALLVDSGSGEMAEQVVAAVRDLVSAATASPEGPKAC